MNALQEHVICTTVASSSSSSSMAMMAQPSHRYKRYENPDFHPPNHILPTVTKAILLREALSWINHYVRNAPYLVITRVIAGRVLIVVNSSTTQDISRPIMLQILKILIHPLLHLNLVLILNKTHHLMMHTKHVRAPYLEITNYTLLVTSNYVRAANLKN